MKHRNVYDNLIASLTVGFLLFTVMCYAGQRGISRARWENVRDAEEITTGSAAVAVKDSGIFSWGLKRGGEGEMPAADPGSEDILRKYDARFIGDTSKKRVYLTFDEGYENGYTPMILDILKKTGVKAVFFITGPYLNEQQGLVRRMVEEGHSVGNHTVSHPSLPTLTEDKIVQELADLERSFSGIFKETMNFMRPPKGEYDEKTLSVARKMNYCTLFWSFAYDDWDVNKQRGKDYAVKMVGENIHPGAVLLLHATSKDNAEGLEEIIACIKEKGYEFGMPSELYAITRGISDGN